MDNHRSPVVLAPGSMELQPVSEQNWNESRQQRQDYAATDDVYARTDTARTATEMDVAALIVNKMIGSGIFTGPYTVLQYTQSKSTAVGLWVLGFGYTVLSMMMYLEYARRLPFTGGELVYLDDLFRSKYRLWAYTLYAFYFVFIYTTCTNAMQFANQVLLAARPDHQDGNNDIQRLLRFLAVTVTTAVCFLLYVSNSKSRLLNKATALVKVVLLLVIIGFGGNYLHSYGSNSLDWLHTAPEGTYTGQHARSWPSAFVTVLFSFHGWENATLVAGEIPSFGVLKRGFRLAVLTVGCLYLTIVCLLCAAFDWKDGPLDNFTASYFDVNAKSNDGKASKSASLATAVIIALSAFGSMLSVAYTGVRVKQTIGWANILPWSWFWRRSGPVRSSYRWQPIGRGQREVRMVISEYALTHPGTPEGGVCLHWIATVAYICITAAFNRIDDAIAFSGNLLVFGHFFAEGLVGLGFIWFDPYLRMVRDLAYPAMNWYRDENDQQPAQWMRPGPVASRSRDSSAQNLVARNILWLLRGRGQTLIGATIFAFSVVIVVAEMFNPMGRTNFWVTIATIGTAWIYWFLLVRESTAKKVYRFFGYELKAQTHGVEDLEDASRLCAWCLSLRTTHRHPHEGYQSYNKVTVRSSINFPLVSYTVLDDHSRDWNTIYSWSDLMRRRSWFPGRGTTALRQQYPLSDEQASRAAGSRG